MNDKLTPEERLYYLKRIGEIGPFACDRTHIGLASVLTDAEKSAIVDVIESAIIPLREKLAAMAGMKEQLSDDHPTQP